MTRAFGWGRRYWGTGLGGREAGMAAEVATVVAETVPYVTAVGSLFWWQAI
jgi:hypothetical protein